MLRSESASLLAHYIHRLGRHHLPVVMQSEVAECGLACVCMVAQYHGHHIDMTALRSQWEVPIRGANLNQLIIVAEQLSLASRPLKLDMEHLTQLQLPAILHWDMQHFVVLKAVKKQHVEIHDPALGQRTITLKEVSNHFTGIALELSPKPDFRPIKHTFPVKLFSFIQSTQGFKRSLILLIILSFSIQLFALISPYYLQLVVDQAIVRFDANMLTVLALGFGLIILLEVTTTMLRATAAQQLACKLNLHMSADVFRHLLRLPMLYFSKRHIGDLLSRFNSLQQVKEILTHGFTTAILDGFMALITFVVMYLYAPQLALVVLATAGMYALLRIVTLNKIMTLNNEQLSLYAHENSHFLETLRGIQVIKTYRMSSSRFQKWLALKSDVVNKDLILGKWGICFAAANNLLFGLENILVVYLAANYVLESLFSVGMLYAFLSYKRQFVAAAEGLITQIFQFKMLNVHLDRLADIVHAQQESQPPLLKGSNVPLLQNDSHLIATNLAFSYGESLPAIVDTLSISIPYGKCIVFVGPSGSGKTTLLKCLMGLFEPTQGSVTLSGLPIAHSQKVASVMQDDQCLSGSILQNITCFDTHINLERAMWAARQACIHEEITAMPMQYQSLIGDIGASLSGGQQQRLLLARALYHQPEILFLDEASSNLDVKNEQRINKNLRQLNITRVIVAHRPQTIALADEVYHFENGQLHRQKPSINVDN